MHGLGNDFMMLDGVQQHIELNPERIKGWADRHRGIGFDQCLIIEPSQQVGIDFNYRIFNADGQEVGQCGNGARCLALFAKRQGLTNKDQLLVATATTQLRLIINSDQTVTVDMGIPKLAPTEIPFLAEQQASSYSIELPDTTSISLHTINVGNPHAVLLVPDVGNAPVKPLGHVICHHPRFPQQTNVGFMQIINPSEIKLRVFERGSGETQACGSGAVAAAAIGQLYHQLCEQVTVRLPGGNLIINWPNQQASISLTGSATFVYDGSITY